MERLFGLDVQLLFDMIIMFVFLMLLFVILTKFPFKPVGAFVEKRAQQIEGIRRWPLKRTAKRIS